MNRILKPFPPRSRPPHVFSSNLNVFILVIRVDPATDYVGQHVEG